MTQAFPRGKRLGLSATGVIPGSLGDGVKEKFYKHEIQQMAMNLASASAAFVSSGPDVLGTANRDSLLKGHMN